MSASNHTRAQGLTLELVRMLERLGYPKGCTAVVLVQAGDGGPLEVGSTTRATPQACVDLVVTAARAMAGGAAPAGYTTQREDGTFAPFITPPPKRDLS